MHCTAHHQTPLGEVLLAADDGALTGLWFRDQKHFARTLSPDSLSRETPILTETKRWLDLYFSGQTPAFRPPLHPAGTDFQRRVWDLLLAIPCGSTTTYGQLAAALGLPRGAQAVGSAVGHNPISILIPCHRVLASDGSLTGYAGGLDKKRALLLLEGAPFSEKEPLASPAKRT